MTLAEYMALDDTQLEAFLDTVAAVPEPLPDDIVDANRITMEDKERIIAQRAAVKANLASQYTTDDDVPEWVKIA